MGWFSDAKKKLKKAAKKVKKAVSKAADKVADAVDKAAATARNAYESAADACEIIPIIGSAVATGTRWLGRVTEGIFDLASAAIRGAGSVIGGILSGALLMLTGDLKDAFLDMFHGVLGGILIVAGSAISLIQTIFGKEQRKRFLTKEEHDLLYQVYCASVQLNQIKIIEGASGVFGFTDRPFTMGNIIYMKNTSQARWNRTLVHEVCHVWQYQEEGSYYSSEALGAQFYFEAQFQSAYNWWDPEVNEGNMVWLDWNREAQAAFVEDLWLSGEVSDNGGPFVLADGVYFTADGITCVGRFRFTPVGASDDAAAVNRWLADVPAGENAIDYSPTADSVRQLLHRDCVRVAPVTPIRTVARG